MLKYIVYKHTLIIECKSKGKSYIGITSSSVEKRWGKNGYNYHTQQKFWRAIKKYGWDAFSHEVLYTDLTEDEANKLEQELIKKYDSKNHGYNADDGGKGSSGHIISESSRKKMSELKKGKPLTDAQWQGAAEGAKKRTLKIYLYNTNKELLEISTYNNIAINYNIPISTIRNFCNSKSVYHNKYIFLKDNNKELLNNIVLEFNNKCIANELPTIYQYNLSGELIATFKKYVDAAVATCYTISEIGKSCNGMRLFLDSNIFLKANDNISDRLELINQRNKYLKTKYTKNTNYIIYQYIKGTTQLVNTFKSYKEAAISTGLSLSQIKANCNGGCNSVKNFRFEKKWIDIIK